MRKFLLQILFSTLPLMIMAVFLFMLNPDKRFSYRFVKGECSNKASWIYDRVFVSEKPMDVVFIGASQTACAVNDERLEKKLAEHAGDTLKVASLGYCRAGRDIQYVMLKEVFRHKKPAVVVIEVTEDEPKKSHPVFPYLAGSKDLLESGVFFNQRFLQALWKGLVIRLEYLKSVLFSDNVLPGDALADHGYLPTGAVAGEELLLTNRRNWEKRLEKQKPLWVRKTELRYSKHYLEKMVNLARENNSRVVFLYLRESGSRLSMPLLYDYYTSLSEVIILQEQVFSDPGNWSDATHLNDLGAALVSDYIAGELAGKLSVHTAISR